DRDRVEDGRAAADAPGQVLRALERPARDDDLRPTLAQVARSQLAHLPRAEEQRALALGAAELTHAELDRRGRHRLRQLVQLRLGPHALAGVQRVLEQPVQQRAGGAARARRLVRVAYLAEDLRLAPHERVEPGRDAEEVRDRLAVVPAGEHAFELEARALLQLLAGPF